MRVSTDDADGGKPSVTRGLYRAFQYRLERFLVSGALYRLAVIAISIVVIVAIFGSLQWWIDGAPGWRSWLAALWWAFLRMTDPGYLGDDEGAARRVISTILTILGYVLFMGALIAIMTSWLHETMRRLEKGLTPIAMRRHVVILGWSERTVEILATLLAADERRVASFLRRTGADRLRFAILAEDVGPHMEVELRQELGDAFDKHRIVLREGDPQRPLDLDRVNCQAASGIVVAGGYSSVMLPAGVDPDARLIRILLTLMAPVSSGGKPPWLVTPVVNPANLPALARTYAAGQLAPLCTPVFVGRLLAQAVQHQGLMAVFAELLSQRRGNAIYISSFPELTDAPYDSLAERFADAVVIGLVTGAGAVLFNPVASGRRLAADERLVIIARHSQPEPLQPASAPVDPIEAAPAAEASFVEAERIAILGNSRLLPMVLDELERAPGSQQVRCLSREFDAEQPQLKRWQSGAAEAAIAVTFTTGDYLDQDTVAALAPEEVDVVLLLGADRLPSAEEADARALLGHQILRSHLERVGAGTRRVCLELRAPGSAKLLDHPCSEILVGGQVVSQALAQVTLRPELGAVYDALFAATGAGLRVVPLAKLGLEASDAIDWPVLRRALRRRRLTAVGVQQGGRMLVNPTPPQLGAIAADARVVVLVG